jgi:hypothetical protein
VLGPVFELYSGAHPTQSTRKSEAQLANETVFFLNDPPFLKRQEKAGAKTRPNELMNAETRDFVAILCC